MKNGQRPRFYTLLNRFRLPVDQWRMPIFIPAAIGALIGRASTKKKKSDKDDFVAVRGRKRADGSTGDPHIRRKRKKK